jgi:hypothetical protein
MKPWWASSVTVALRGRRVDDEEEEFGGLGEFEEDDEFDEDLDEDEYDEDADEENDLDYDDFDDEFDDDGEPRRGGRPRREWE